MRLKIVPIRELASQNGLIASEIFPPQRSARESTVEFTNIDEVDFPRRDVVKKNYAGVAVDYASTIHAVLDNAYILDDGVIIYGGAIVAETLPASVQRNLNKYNHLTPAGDGEWDVDLSGAVQCDDLPKYSIARYGVEYYGHWLTEVLPRLRELRYSASILGSDVLLPKSVNPGVPNGMWPTMKASAAAVGVDLSDATVIPAGGMRVKSLHYISPMGHWGSIRREATRTFNEILERAPKPSGPRRLYVTRNDTGNRRLENEDQIFSLLQQHGFEMFRPSDHSFMDQVSAFASADAIAGPLGSALTNTVFAPDSAKILPLIPELWDDLFFFDLACLKGQPWFELRGPVTTQTHPLYQRNDFRVDPVAMGELLDRVFG
ncbi:glycosyltransferase family 61 protein [Arthrobacter sp. 9MFCol3.1]|uniref:glycosyltransferase family 61 protein n=1 Tax=Arthrobacter sp. 9MFCol3.1 TaxID=1150398 RepID=UPI00047E2F58|nr:glycosyltransferase family 61 protein [Arthrobacter sp. 9MFCol3.1]